jgi:RNA recognition motif-containing protein
VSDVSINIDKLNGKSKGFGFVTMNDARDAADAVKALNHMELCGREILVDVAHGGGSNTGFISRPKVYSRTKNQRQPSSRSRDSSSNYNGRDHDRASPNGHNSSSYDSTRDRYNRGGDYDHDHESRYRRSRSRSRER